MNSFGQTDAAFNAPHRASVKLKFPNYFLNDEKIHTTIFLNHIKTTEVLDYIVYFFFSIPKFGEI